MAKQPADGDDSFGRLFVLGGFVLVPCTGPRTGERRADIRNRRQRPPVHLTVVRSRADESKRTAGARTNDHDHHA